MSSGMIGIWGNEALLGGTAFGMIGSNVGLLAWCRWFSMQSGYDICWQGACAI